VPACGRASRVLCQSGSHFRRHAATASSVAKIHPSSGLDPNRTMKLADIAVMRLRASLWGVSRGDGDLPGGPRRPRAPGPLGKCPSQSFVAPSSLAPLPPFPQTDAMPARHEFASDNTAPICSEVWDAIEKANRGAAASYGEDEWTAQLCERVRDLFETDCQVFLVFNGTAANALALAQLCRPFHSVICHERAHIETDECGAPEFFSGSKLLLVRGNRGKIDIGEAKSVIGRQPELHAQKPRVISVGQATELGTVYQRHEIRALSEFARERSLFVHMDGARFANAVASLGCAPKEISWQSGVDVLCFGGTKNGLAAGELVVFFTKDLAREFDYRIKQAGQLGSKMRFLAAGWLALLENDLWLRNAEHANGTARRLAQKLRALTKIDILFPVEANAIFVRLEDRVANALQAAGWHFYKFIEPDVYRFMCSWATSERAIEDFVAEVKCVRNR
jgi:threonine aldolase